MADVLIIDDDAAGAARLARLLGRDGHTARCAADVGAALHALREREPDLVLLDLGLPRTDGLTLLDALRDDPRFADTRVAVYTGRDDDAARDAARRLGACAFIVKGGAWADTSRQVQRCLVGPSVAAATAPGAAPSPPG
jgi:CheY-like chemotaxis protein